MDIHEALGIVQKKIKCEKGNEVIQDNKVKYKYRNAEDILSSAKEHLVEGCSITMDDELIEFVNKEYMKSTAYFHMGDRVVSASSYVPITKPMYMNAAQWFGALSSYARKYALCGLLAVDEGNDAMDSGQVSPKEPDSSGDSTKPYRAPIAPIAPITNTKSYKKETPQQLKRLEVMEYCKNNDISGLEAGKAAKNKFNGTSFDHLTIPQYKELLAYFKSMAEPPEQSDLFPPDVTPQKAYTKKDLIELCQNYLVKLGHDKGAKLEAFFSAHNIWQQSWDKFKKDDLVLVEKKLLAFSKDISTFKGAW